MPGPVSATLTRTAIVVAPAALQRRCGAPAAQNLSALSTRLATARSNSSMSSAANGGRSPPAPRCGAVQRDALARGARRRSAARCRRAARRRRPPRAAARTAARRAGQVAQRLHQPRRVARVAQRHLDQAPVVAARRRRRPSGRPASPGRRPWRSAASAGRATGCSRLRGGSGRAGAAPPTACAACRASSRTRR